MRVQKQDLFFSKPSRGKKKKGFDIPIQYQRDQQVKKNCLSLARHQNSSHKFIVVQVIIKKKKSFAWVQDFLVPRGVVDCETSGIFKCASQRTAEGS